MAATKVLVVDDDLNIQRVLVFTLKQEGFEVLVASDGEAGVELARTGEPELILMDVAMPKLDGYAATQRIRQGERAGARVPIIMLTSEADVGERVKGLRAGADDDIVKPFHPLELIARIRALLARSGAGTREGSVDHATLGRLGLFYGAKGGVGTTTIAINSGICLTQEFKRRTLLIDANLQFGDLRVFLDLGLESASIVNAINEPDLDTELFKKLVVRHHSALDLLLAPTSPEAADIVVERQRSDPGLLSNVLGIARRLYDYTLIDMAKSIDDFNLQLFDEADVIWVVMTADLSCLKNVQLVLNRSNAFTGINVKNAESVLGRKIDHQVINEYRGAISAMNSGEPFMSSRPDGPLGRSVADFAREVDRQATAEVAAAIR